MNQKENFMYTYPEQNANYISKNSRNSRNKTSSNDQVIFKRALTNSSGDLIEDINSNDFCYDDVTLNVNNPSYTSNNYKIVGSANPKTFIPPVIVPPIADLGYWKSNNLNTHSQINDNKNIDVYLSGYEVSNFCGNNSCRKQKGTEKYTKFQQEEEYVFNQNHNNKYHDKYNKHQQNTHKHLRENFEDFPKNKIENVDLVNKSCSYNENQMEYGLPANMKTYDCQKDSKLTSYNKNLFTQIIQPGVYTVNNVNEPINSNIGISFDQQFEPLSVDENEFGITFTEHNPLTYDGKNILKYNENEIIEPITQANVYDPRFTGYGTSYRAYTDTNIGQTRFFYDDVDAVRMPNYVTRSKIDSFDFADKYDTMDNQHGNINNSTIRALANQKFLDDALEFRTGMQERLMRKTNAEAWQQRMKPITTGGQRMLGGRKNG